MYLTELMKLKTPPSVPMMMACMHRILITLPKGLQMEYYYVKMILIWLSLMSYFPPSFASLSTSLM